MMDVELIQLCIPYGPISNYMMLKGKSQAFVEYEDESSAVNFVTGMTNVPIQVRRAILFIIFFLCLDSWQDHLRPVQYTSGAKVGQREEERG